MTGDPERDEICGEVRDFLAGEDGPLSAREAYLLQRHLDECDGCRKVRQEHRAIWDLIGKAPAPISQVSDKEFLAGVRGRLRRGSFLRWAATLAAAASVTIAAVLFTAGGSAVDEQAVIDNLDVLQALDVAPLPHPDDDTAAIGRELLGMISEQERGAREKESEGGEEIWDETTLDELDALLEHALKG